MSVINTSGSFWRGPATGMAVLALCCVANAVLAQTVIVTRAECDRLVAHIPDQGVQYKPGVDVRGRSVASANLGGRPQLQLPETVDIPVQIDLQKRYGLPANSDLYKMDEVTVGTARVRVSDGRAWFNGKPLTSDDQYAMEQACRKQRSPLTR